MDLFFLYISIVGIHIWTSALIIDYRGVIEALLHLNPNFACNTDCNEIPNFYDENKFTVNKRSCKKTFCDPNFVSMLFCKKNVTFSDNFIFDENEAKKSLKISFWHQYIERRKKSQ